MSTFKNIFGLAVLTAAMAVAAPLCLTGTYDEYDAIGFSCTIGGETFSGFSQLNFLNSVGVPTIPATAITVTPGTSGDTSTLAFTYDSPITVTGGAQVFSFVFSYDAVATSGLALTAFRQDASFSNTSPGSASFTKNGQADGGGPVFTSSVTSGGGSNAPGTYTGNMEAVTGGGVPFLVQDTISLQAQAGTVSNSGFVNNFVTTPVTGEVPEPPVSLLIGTGLVLLGGLTRKIAERRRRSNA